MNNPLVAMSRRLLLSLFLLKCSFSFYVKGKVMETFYQEKLFNENIKSF